MDSEGYVSLYSGVVTNNQDPLKIGRVRLRVPGLLEGETGWALPIGSPGAGEKQLGFFSVPVEGAEVGVWFIQGDPDRPCYVAGHWGAPGGQSQAPTPVQAVTAAEAPHIRCLETPRFLLTFDDRQGHESVEIRDKVSGDGILMHGAQRAIEINATVAIKLRTTGAIKLDALAVTIMGRPVKPGSKPI